MKREREMDEEPVEEGDIELGEGGHRVSNKSNSSGQLHGRKGSLVPAAPGGGGGGGGGEAAAVPNFALGVTIANTGQTPFVPVNIIFEDIVTVVQVPRRDDPALQVLSQDPASVKKHKLSQQKEKMDRKLLDGVSGVINPGSMMAVMGPSGAGKSTLLDILSLRRPLSSGRVLFNGEEIDKDALQEFSGYVTQVDNLTPTLTVRETLDFYARLKLPKDTSKMERQMRVNKILEDMGLLGSQDTMIGDGKSIRGISGGQRRRVSIGVELLTEPAVLFLDEPTSGLDAATSVHVMQLLNKLADSGRTIVCTIHQPRSQIFQLFDKLLLLAEGQSVFQGQATDASEWFAELGYPVPDKVNPSDHFLDVLTFYDVDNPKEKLKEITDAYQASDTNNKVRNAIQEVENTSIPGFKRRVNHIGVWAQFRTVLWRANLNQYRNPALFRSRVMQALFASVLVGLIFLQLDHSQTSVQSRTGVITTLLLLGVMPTLNAVIGIFPSEKDVLVREQNSKCYLVGAYYMARILVDIPSQVLAAFIMGSVAYWMVGLNSDAGAFFIFLSVLILATLCGHALGLTIGAVSFNNPNVGAAFGPLIALVFTMFAGFFVNTEDIPIFLRWIQWISFVKYGFQALMINEFSGVTLTCTAEEISLGRCTFPTGDAVLDRYNLRDGSVAGTSIWFGIVMVMIIILVFRVLGYLVLKSRTKNQVA